MNAGLGNLDSLKQHLLPSLPRERKFDPIILDIGRGVAAAFDRYCNRRLCYGEGMQEIFTGDRPHWYASAYPVVAFTTVELRYFRSDPWTDISGQPLANNEETGLLDFGYTLGRRPIQVRVTYTAGYWFNTAEPGDNPYPCPAPAALATAPLAPAKYWMPEDLRLAWLTQCRRVWDSFDKLGLGLVDTPKKQTDVNELSLAPEVRQFLRGFRRYQLT